MLSSSKIAWIIIGVIFLIIIVMAVLFVLFADERERRQAEREAGERRRLKHEMTGNISHELKTPVSCIMGYLETLLNHPELPEEKRILFLGHAYQQSQRLSEMITDISTITKLEEVPEQFKIEDVNIKDTFNDIIEELAEQISAHRFSVLNELPPVCIHANFSLIYAIFRNLVENSLKYAGECCNIYISYSSRGRGIHEFDYHDTGRGVPEDKLDRIFERFYRLDEDRSSEKGGSGLGLSIVRNSVLFHKGTIFAYNVQGGGLGFHFTLKDLS